MIFQREYNRVLVPTPGWIERINASYPHRTQTSQVPLECHQFDWITETGLLEGLMSIPLDRTIVQKILKGTSSDIIDALIE